MPNTTNDELDPTAAVAMVRAYLTTPGLIAPEPTRLGEHDGIFAMRWSYPWGDVIGLQTVEHIPWSDPRWTVARARFLPASALSLGPEPIGNACVRILLWAVQPLTLIEARA